MIHQPEEKDETGGRRKRRGESVAIIILRHQ
jgi:hypothetical protein